MVHHTSPMFIQLRGRPTPGYSRSNDRPTQYISRSSSRRVCRSDSRSTVEDSRVLNRPTQQSTTSWTNSRSGRASLSSRLDNADLVESTLTIDKYMWTRSSIFYGAWLDLEAINSRPLGSLSSCKTMCNRSYGSTCAIQL
jgi:hypothetical protein